MRYVVDTHTLLWYLSDDARLGSDVRQILSDPDKLLLIPIIVLAEAKHAADRRRVNIAFDKIAQEVAASPRINVLSMDLTMINYLSSQLDIHDAFIVATARYCQDYFREEISVLTNDLAITQSGLVNVIW
jgi:PIN domain nuclease of toxin-antitoxin system